MEGLSFSENLIQLNSAAILQLSKKVDAVMSAVDSLKAAEASLSVVVSDAVSRIRALETAIAAVPPTNEAAIEEVASRLAGLREMLAAAVYAPPAPEVVAEAPAPAPEVVAEPVPAVTPSGAPIVETAAIPSIGG